MSSLIDLNGKLRLHGGFRHSLERIGNEHSPVLVVDNFLSDPQVLIEYAATSAEFGSVSDAFYPGIRAPIPQIYAFAVRAFLGDLIGGAFELGRARVTKELASFSLLTTPRDRLQVVQRLPHFDNTDDRQIAVLHYLCPATFGGTSFYRHRTTGFETIRPHRLERYSRAIDAELAAHVSFDVDYLDPDIAPGVGTTVPGGPSYREAQLCMEMIADTGQLASLDIVELNPALDVRNKTAALAVDLIESLFGKSTLMRRESAAPMVRAVEKRAAK